MTFKMGQTPNADVLEVLTPPTKLWNRGLKKECVCKGLFSTHRVGVIMGTLGPNVVEGKRCPIF